MELVPGSSLEEELGRGRDFSWREVTRIGIETARALRHAHDRGVIHRDIKPGNLLMTAEGQVKLSDFGIARFFGGSLHTVAGSLLGTAEYMSPEQAEGRPVGPRSDLYSLGGVLYALLARRPLFRGNSLPEILHKQRFEQPAPLGELAKDVPAELEQIVSQLIEKGPERRIPNAAVLLRRLEAIEQSLSPRCDAGGSRSRFAAGRPTSRDQGHAAFRRTSKSPPLRCKTDPPAPTQPTGRFTLVGNEDLDRVEKAETSGVRHLIQAATLAIGLAAIGVIMWYWLQPPSADALFDRIQSRAIAGDSETLRQADDDIRAFLRRFPADPRGEQLRQYRRDIELDRLQRRFDRLAKGLGPTESLTPVEQAYLDALNYARLDPELGMAKFQALLDLYGEASNPKGSTGRCLELARRQLARLLEEADAAAPEQLSLVKKRLARADQLRLTDPASRRVDVSRGDRALSQQALGVRRRPPGTGGADEQDGEVKKSRVGRAKRAPPEKSSLDRRHDPEELFTFCNDRLKRWTTKYFRM